MQSIKLTMWKGLDRKRGRGYAPSPTTGAIFDENAPPPPTHFSARQFPFPVYCHTFLKRRTQMTSFNEFSQGCPVAWSERAVRGVLAGGRQQLSGIQTHSPPSRACRHPESDGVSSLLRFTPLGQTLVHVHRPGLQETLCACVGGRGHSAALRTTKRD